MDITGMKEHKESSGGETDAKRTKTDNDQSFKAVSPSPDTPVIERIFDIFPLGTLLEVFGWLFPFDLLHLSRASKRLRAILMNKSTANVWRRARHNVGLKRPIPPPPNNYNEPQWAKLLFYFDCDSCGSCKQDYLIDWVRLYRICEKCHDTLYTVPEDYEDKAFGKIDEDDYDEVDEFVDAFPDIAEKKKGESVLFFYKEDVDRAVRTLASYRKEQKMNLGGTFGQRSDFMKNMTQKRRVALKQAEKYMYQSPPLESIVIDLVLERRALITRKLKELGYIAESIRFKSYPSLLVFESGDGINYFINPVTDGYWENVVDVLKPEKDPAALGPAITHVDC